MKKTRGGRQREPKAPRADYGIQALERGLAILEQFDHRRPMMTLTEITGAVGGVLSSTMRALRTLEDLGFVEQSLEGGLYRPGLGAARLGQAAIATAPLLRHARPVLEELHARLGTNVNLDVLVGHEVCRVARLRSYNLLVDDLKVGTFLPVYCTASGRALLMHRPEAEIRAILDRQGYAPLTPATPTSAAAVAAEIRASRERGYAFADGEFAQHLRLVSAPVRDLSGQTVAAVSIGSQARLVPLAVVHGVHAREAMAAALRISAGLAAEEAA